MSFLYNAFKNAPAIGKKIKSTITGMKPKKNFWKRFQ